MRKLHLHGAQQEQGKRTNKRIRILKMEQERILTSRLQKAAQRRLLHQNYDQNYDHQGRAVGVDCTG